MTDLLVCAGCGGNGGELVASPLGTFHRGCLRECPTCGRKRTDPLPSYPSAPRPPAMTGPEHAIYERG